MPEQEHPKVIIVLRMKRGLILECLGKRWYERTGVRRNQYSTKVRAYTMDQDCYNIITQGMCEYCIYHTPDGLRAAALDHVWKSVKLHDTAGLKRYPAEWFNSVEEMIAEIKKRDEPEPEPELEIVEPEPEIDWEA